MLGKSLVASRDAEDARSEMGVSGLLGLSRDVSKDKAKEKSVLNLFAGHGSR